MNNIHNELAQYKNELQRHKDNIAALNNRKIVEETNLKHILDREAKLIAEIASKGIDPGDLTCTIEKKRKELSAIMNKLSQMIPADGNIPNNVSDIIGSMAVNSKPTEVKVQVQDDGFDLFNDVNLDDMDII